MKLKLQRDQALPPLSLVTGVVERRQTLPILANVLLESSNDTLRLIGTDLEVEILIEVTAENTAAGTTTVNARKLLDIWPHAPQRCNTSNQPNRKPLKNFSLDTADLTFNHYQRRISRDLIRRSTGRSESN